MRILVQDYAGHPFQIELSRALATRGHVVVHAYCASVTDTPKGALSVRPDDPPGLTIHPIDLPRRIRKNALWQRWYLERRYGKRLAAQIHGYRPSVVLLANTPLDAALVAMRACRQLGAPVVWWLQDLIGEATERILGDRFGVLGRVVGRHYKRIEKRLLKRSARVIGISDDFRGPATDMGVPANHYTTIMNWAPLSELCPRGKRNRWAAAQGLERSFVFLYSGTLGFKHNPALLLELARAFSKDKEVWVVVNSLGDAADWLNQTARGEGLGRLRVNSYQPYEAMSDVLATADVLVGILEPDAGRYSVPSKVLTYHCAARPLLLAVPQENLASRIVRKERSGLVTDPRDAGAFVNAARRLYEEEDMRRQMAARARAYAERTFDIERIAGEFEQVLERAVGRVPATPVETFGEARQRNSQ